MIRADVNFREARCAVELDAETGHRMQAAEAGMLVIRLLEAIHEENPADAVRTLFYLRTRLSFLFMDRSDADVDADALNLAFPPDTLVCREEGST